MKSDLKDVEVSAMWYQNLFGFISIHGGENFSVLASRNDEILLCLHKWGEHEHPTMTKASTNPGNGLILYFRTDDMNLIRQNVAKIGATVEEDIHLNPNSLKNEFSLRDPDGYYLTITEYHKYEG